MRPKNHYSENYDLKRGLKTPKEYRVESFYFPFLIPLFYTTYRQLQVLKIRKKKILFGMIFAGALPPIRGGFFVSPIMEGLTPRRRRWSKHNKPTICNWPVYWPLISIIISRIHNISAILAENKNSTDV